MTSYKFKCTTASFQEDGSVTFETKENVEVIEIANNWRLEKKQAKTVRRMRQQATWVKGIPNMEFMYVIFPVLEFLH